MPTAAKRFLSAALELPGAGLQWIQASLKPRPKTPKSHADIRNRSSRRHEDLTKEERLFVASLGGASVCCDCGGRLLGGPEGGGSKNFMCGTCTSEFNLGPDRGLLFGERIGPAGNAPPERLQIYGLRPR